MTTENFTKAQFENALPENRHTGELLWDVYGLQEGEFTYGIHLANNVVIMIRSSVKADGFAASTGKDSIRLWFTKGGKPHGSKLGCYITRVKGWQDRLLIQLRLMYKRGMSLNYCEVCGEPKAMFKATKDGHLFQACPDHFNATYEKYEGK